MRIDIVVQWGESKILSTYVHSTWEEGERKDFYQRGHSCGLRATGRRGGLRDWKLAVKRLGKSWYYALCMGLCNGTCSPTRELAPSFVVYDPIGNSTTRTWTCDPVEPSVARLIPAKAPCSGNFDLYILHTSTSACGYSQYFPVVCHRVTFLIVIRHTNMHDMRVCVSLYRYMYPPMYASLCDKRKANFLCESRWSSN